MALSVASSGGGSEQELIFTLLASRKHAGIGTVIGAELEQIKSTLSFRLRRGITR